MSSGSHGPRNIPFRGARQSYRGSGSDESASRASQPRSIEGDGDDFAVDAAELARRKYELSDYYSSFSETALPWEWAEQQNLASRITLVEATLHSSNWTEKGDPERSLIKWACYERESTALKLFNKIKAPRERTTVCRQKLKRRIDEHLTQYSDGLVDAEVTTELLRDLTKRAEEDRVWRGEGDHDRELWRILLSLLEKVSDAVEVPQGVGPTPPFEETLFYEVFVLDHNNDFLLGILEQFDLSSLDAATRAQSGERAMEIYDQLVRYGARQAYSTRLGRIFSRVSTP